MTVTELRPFTVGGSEAAAACGVNPWQSQLNLWAVKTGQQEPPPTTEAALWGTLLEPVILAVLGNAHGFTVTEADAEFRDPERPWMVGHPDAFGEKDGISYVIDAKTTGGWNASQWAGDDDAPTQYLCQLYHYMHLTGMDHGLLACLIGGQRLALRTVERDPEAIDLILRLEEQFVEMCASGEMPAPAGSRSDAEAIGGMHPAGQPGKTIELGPDELHALEQYHVVDRAYQRVKTQRETLKQHLQLAMQDAEIAETPAGIVAAKWTTFLRNGAVSRRFTVTANGGE